MLGSTKPDEYGMEFGHKENKKEDRRKNDREIIL